MNTDAVTPTPGFPRVQTLVQHVGWPIEGLEEMPAAALVA